MINPNKYVRKALYDAIKDTYTCYDMQVTGKTNPTQYVLISTQNKEIDKATKRGDRFISYTLLDIVCIYNGAGNVGSRAANDDMENTILGLIENMSGVLCPMCGEEFQLFGPARGKEVAEKININFLGSIPIDPNLSRLCDQGKIEEYDNILFTDLIPEQLINSQEINS